MKKIIRMICIGFAALVSTACLAATSTTSGIQGNWQTIDKKTHQPSSIVSIRKENNAYVGTITKIFAENQHNPTDVCRNCKGDLHNKPILNMNILHAQIEPTGAVKQCMVLDPQIGKVYHCTLKVTDKGQTLKLRGYIGMPLLGRTDEWHRVTKEGTHKS